MSRRIMRAFKMHEISAVDRPAQVGARATIMKRDDSGQESTGEALPDGSLEQNANHATSRASKLRKVSDMTPEEVQTMIADAVAKSTATLQTEIATLKGKKPPPFLNDGDAEPDADDDTKKAWRDHVAKKVNAAIALTKSELEAEFAKRDEIAKADEVIKDESGNEIRKSVVGEQTFKFMKAQQDKIEISEFGKRAETEIPHLPGDQALKAKVLRAVSKLDKEIRDGLEAMLKGGSAAVRSMTKSAGIHTLEATSAEGQMETLARDLASKTSVSYHEAYGKVLETKEGAELYNKMQSEKRSAA